MSYRVIACLLVAVATCAAGAAETIPSPARIGALAQHVPVDAQLFLEVRDAAGLSETPAGDALGDVLAWLMAQVKAEAGGQPLEGQGWKQLFAGALGLQNNRIADELLTGRLAIAADGWSTLSASVLLAEPVEPTVIESLLQSQLVTGSQNQRVRRYRLGRDLEIASTGRLFVLGKNLSATDLYARTLKLIGSDHGLCLADLADFRERMGEVPAGAQAILYLSTNLRPTEGAETAGAGWWLAGPRLRSAAVAVELNAEGLVVETTGRRVTPLDTLPGPRDPPIDALLFLPASAVAAWTYPIDYLAELQQFKKAAPAGVATFYLNLLQWRMRPDALENGLLGHLVGDTIFMIGRVAVRPRGAVRDQPALIVPTFALSVETDDPDTVEATLEEMSPNLLRLVNLQSGPQGRASVHAETLSDIDESTVIRSIPLAMMLPAGTMRELLGSMELSWAVADRRLVIGTHRETVRQIVLAHRGEAPLMPAEAIQQAMGREQQTRRLPDMVFVAQPQAAAEIIDSWLQYIARNHPGIQQPQWWQQLRRRYTASQVQLGIRSVMGGPPGVVEVAQTLPDWPAHGRLKPGDRITAVDGRDLDPLQTLQSLRGALAARPRDDRVRLTVIRQGSPIEIDIPMPTSSSPADQVHPLTLLQQIASLSRRFAFGSYVTWQPSRELVQTRLELRLATTPIPLTVDGPSSWDDGTTHLGLPGDETTPPRANSPDEPTVPAAASLSEPQASDNGQQR